MSTTPEHSNPNPYQSFGDSSAEPPPPAVPESPPSRFRWFAVLIGVAADVVVFIGTAMVIAWLVLVPASGGDLNAALDAAFRRPWVPVLLVLGSLLGHVTGGFAAGRIAGGRAMIHGLAVAAGFTGVVTLLAFGTEVEPTPAFPEWLSTLELVTRWPCAVGGAALGVASAGARFGLPRVRR